MLQQRCSRRRFLSLGAAAATGALAAACAPAAPQPAPTAAATAAQGEAAPTAVPQAATAAPATAKPASLTVVMTGEAGDLQANLEPFTRANPGITVEVIPVAHDGFDEKVDLLIAGGTPPAIWYPAAYAESAALYYVKGVAVDIAPYLDQAKFDWSDWYKLDPDGQTLEGHRFGIAYSVFPEVLLYNKDLFDAGGVPYPPTDWDDKTWTWDEFISRAKALTKPEKDPLQTTWGLEGWDRRFGFLDVGADLWPEDAYRTQKPEKSLASSEPMRYAYQLQHDTVWKHKTTPTPEQDAAFSKSTQATWFLSNKAAIEFGYPWYMGDVKQAGFKWDLAAMPVNSYGGWRGNMYVGSWAMFKVAEQDAAWALYQFVVSQEGMGLAVELEANGKANGLTQTGIPMRKSVAAKWAEAQSKATGLGNELFQHEMKAIEKVHIDAGMGCPCWAEAWHSAVEPNRDLIMMDKATVDEATAAMDKAIAELLARS